MSTEQQEQEEASYHFALCKFVDLVKSVGAQQVVNDLPETIRVELFKELLFRGEND